MAEKLDFRVKQGLIVSTTATIEGTTNATSTTTGALLVAGGVGIQKNLYVGGDIVAERLIIQYTTVTTQSIQTDDIIQTNNSTQATSTSTGAFVVAGGAGIGGNVYVGGTLNVSGAITGNLTGTASNVNTIAANTSTTHYLTFVDSNNASSTSELIYTTSSVTISPNTGNVVIGGNLTVSNGITGTITTATNLASGSTYSLVYQSSAGTTAFLAPSQIGYVLQTNSTTSAPSWVALSGVTSGSATTATNLAGGTLGQVPYQSSTGGTSFAAVGSTGTVFVSNGAAAPTWNNTLTLAGTTDSSSTITGALVVSGGVGIGKNANIGGTLNVTGTITGNVTGNLTGTASNVNTIAANTSTTHYLTFVDSNNASSTSELIYTTSSVTISPSTGNVVIGGTLNVTGAITGNITGNLTGIADQVKTVQRTTAGNHFLTFVDSNNASGTGEVFYTTSSFTINPNTNEVIVTGTLAYNNTQLSNYTSSAITTTTTQNLDTFPHATYRTAKYLAQVTLGSNYQFSEFGVLHNGTTVYLNEYGIMTTAGQFGTFDAIITGTNVVITWTANTTTSHIVKLSRIAITV